MRFAARVAQSFTVIDVNVQQHRICFVIGLLVCNSTRHRPLSRIYGTAEHLHYVVCPFKCGIKLDIY